MIESNGSQGCLSNLVNMLDRQFLTEYEQDVKCGRKTELFRIGQTNQKISSKVNEDKLKKIIEISKKNGKLYKITYLTYFFSRKARKNLSWG